MGFQGFKANPPAQFMGHIRKALPCALPPDSNVQRNGRQGQPQAGVDVFGSNQAQVNGAPGNGAGGFWGVPCKQKSLGQKVSQSGFDAELAKAELFQPTLAHWILATTCDNDVHLQEHVRQVSAARQQQGLFPVSICSWDGICSLLVAFTPIPNHSSKFCLPGISLAEHFNDPRQLLAQLRTRLLASGSSAVLAGAKAVLHGMGGVGKTQLALQYCHRFKDEYSGVWWLQAETMAALHHYALCQSGSTISSDHVGNGKQRIRSLHLHRLSQVAMRTRRAESGRTALVLVTAVFPYDAE